MNRLVVLVTALVALVTAATVVWMEVRQEREFRRLVAEGDAALQADRTSEAIEAFSGALAFRALGVLHDHLMRGNRAAPQAGSPNTTSTNSRNVNRAGAANPGGAIRHKRPSSSTGARQIRLDLSNRMSTSLAMPPWHP